MTTSEPRESFASTWKCAVRGAVRVGLTLGIFEALIIGARVLLSNTWSLMLFADLVKFVSLAAVLYVGFMLAGGLIAAAVVSLLFRGAGTADAARREAWLLRFCWLWGIAFLFGIWVNYNSTRALVSTTSLLYDLAVVVGAAAAAFVAARMTSRWSALDAPLAVGKGRTLLLAWMTVLALAFVQGMTASMPARTDKPNVVLLIIDTLRDDRMGCYGYERNTTPAMDAIGKEGVLFEQTYVQWASSLPSHASIMTSTYPHVHGAFPNGKSLNPKFLTLAKILKEQGYANGAFVTNSLVGNQYNFQLGYDTFIDMAALDYKNTTSAAWVHGLNLIRVVDQLTDNDFFTELALSWLDAHQNGPFLLWMQWLYPHAPYRPPAGFLKKFESGYTGIANGSLAQIDLINKKKLQLSAADEQHYTNLYDAEVAFSDYQAGRILDRLRELNLMDNSLVIITADHGENLNEHGMEYGHYGVYDSSLRIPLIFYMPKRLPSGERISQVVQSIDIAPTILDLLGIARPEQFQGRSLRALIEEDTDHAAGAQAQSVMFRDNVNFLSLRSGDWKVLLKVRDGENYYELYHIPSDPKELDNLFESNRTVADSLKAALTGWIEQNFNPTDLVYVPGTYFKEDFDKATIARLRALGYVK